MTATHTGNGPDLSRNDEATHQAGAHSVGKVYLIGAGPGDPDLITVKGLRLLREADVILYDRLIDPTLLQETRSEATRIYVGKKAGHHTLPQDEINEQLIEHARNGKTVVRLKGGDPFVFGRGGEEAEALLAHNIPFEVVPGVTSAIAVPAYSGIPVTHRNYTNSLTVVTGHESNSRTPQVNWEVLAKLGGTIIVLMGLKGLPSFTQRLIAAGLATTTPAAVIQEGTLPQQRIIRGTILDIAQRAKEAELDAPALTIIGDVVNLHDTLDWYHRTVQHADQDATAEASATT